MYVHAGGGSVAEDNDLSGNRQGERGDEHAASPAVAHHHSAHMGYSVVGWMDF